MYYYQFENVLAQAQSGTGKTGTFTISALQSIDQNQRKTQVIILALVRKLAKQIYDMVKGIGQCLNIEAFCCIGGIVLINQFQKSPPTIPNPRRPEKNANKELTLPQRHQVD